MTQSTTLRGKKYSGDLYARKFGTEDAFVKLGNVTEFTTSQEVEKEELKSTGKYDYGQALEADVIPQPIEVSLSFNTFDNKALARALMGEALNFAGSVQTLTDVAGVVKLGGLIKLSHDDIDPEHFDIKDKNQRSIDKSHYKLLADIGMVQFLAGASVKEGEAFTYSGKTKGTSGFSIDANTLHALDFEMYLDGRDRITGKNGVLSVPHVKLSADGSLDWFADEWMSSSLTGTIIKEDGKAAMTFKEFG